MSAAPNLGQIKPLRIEVTMGPLKGKVYTFSKSVVSIGRSTENDIQVENDIKMSRTHVEIRQIGNTISIQNMNDKNTMMVNGQILSFFPLQSNNCMLRVGESEFQIHTEGAQQKAIQKPLYVPTVVSSLPVNKTPGMTPPPAPIGSGFPATASSALSYPTSVQGKNQVGPHQPNQFQYYGGAGGAQKDSKILFYGLIGLIIIVGVWLFNGDGKKNKKIDLRTSDDIEFDINNTYENIKKIETQNKTSNKNDIQYQTAQQHYLKGFRDYKQGQYGRAILSLQAALAFYPKHELAQRYSILARRKLDEIVKFEMVTGLKYKAQGNYRMCASSYKKVLTMISDEKDSTYSEASTYLRECELMQKERY